RESAPDLPDVDARWIRDSETVWDDDGRKMVKQTVSARGFYRVAWRNMAANTGERTFIAALLPPGPTHIHGVASAGSATSLRATTLFGGYASSLIHDFAVRAAPKSTISASTIDRLPLPSDPRYEGAILLRSLRLNG